jgi:hypothetical protein
LQNALELKNTINPSLFYLEVQQNKKSLCITTPKPFANATYELLDFLFVNKMIHPVEVILWKKKNHEEVYLG